MRTYFEMRTDGLGFEESKPGIRFTRRNLRGVTLNCITVKMRNGLFFWKRTGSVLRKPNLQLGYTRRYLQVNVRITKGRAARARYPPAIHLSVFSNCDLCAFFSQYICRYRSFARIELMITAVVAVRLLWPPTRSKGFAQWVRSPSCRLETFCPRRTER